MGQTFVIVCPLEALHAGQSFSRRAWPLHVTVGQNFRWDGGTEALVALVDPVLRRARRCAIQVGVEALFGAHGAVEVSLVEPSSVLTALHEQLVLDGMAFAEPQYLSPNYRPHITHVGKTRPQEGDRVTLESAALVELRGDAAEVVATWAWGPEIGESRQT